MGPVLRILLALLLGFLASGEPITPRVVSWPAGPCAVDWHLPRGAVVLACPGRDQLRLWPLPPVAPWAEDDFVPGSPPEPPPRA